jgi:hypothetical protein
MCFVDKYRRGVAVADPAEKKNVQREALPACFTYHRMLSNYA